MSHLSKPVRQADLRRAVSEAAGLAPQSMPSVAADAARQTIDAKALDNIRALQSPGAPLLLDRIIGLYLADAPRHLQAMRGAMSAADAKTLQHAAHQLTSSSANLGAFALAELCKTVEADARAERYAHVQRSMSAIDEEYARVSAALSALAAPA